MPLTVLEVLYSAQAVPVIHPRSIDSIGNIFKRRTSILRDRMEFWRSDGKQAKLEGNSRLKKCVFRCAILSWRYRSQYKLQKIMSISY